uniref:Uncharacterized protein n=1 Tax=Catharus ustulatus TaxID=91951 RepID=A0A8C3UDV0_CATUS
MAAPVRDREALQRLNFLFQVRGGGRGGFGANLGEFGGFPKISPISLKFSPKSPNFPQIPQNFPKILLKSPKFPQNPPKIPRFSPKIPQISP